MKTCGRCRETKTPAEFPPDRRLAGGRQGTCRVCTNARERTRTTARRGPVTQTDAFVGDCNAETAVVVPKIQRILDAHELYVCEVAAAT